MIRLTFLIFFISFKASSTIVIKKDYFNRIKLIGHQVEVGDFDTIKIRTTNSVYTEIVCAKNRFFKEKRAHIKYRNYYNIPLGNFYFTTNEICENLKHFLTAVFIGINRKNPIIFILDRNKKHIQKIIYPNIDPYLYFEDKGKKKKNPKPKKGSNENTLLIF